MATESVASPKVLLPMGRKVPRNHRDDCQVAHLALSERMRDNLIQALQTAMRRLHRGGSDRSRELWSRIALEMWSNEAPYFCF